MELEEAGLPISVTLVKPSAIDTPYIGHAKNYMSVEPKNPPPVYAPDVVAKTILYCAQHPERDVTVGAGGRILSAMGSLAPRMTDRVMERTMFRQQQTNEPARPRDRHSLYAASEGLRERGDYQGHVSESSLYTRAALHPVLFGAAVLGAGLAVAGAVIAATGSHRPAARKAFVRGATRLKGLSRTGPAYGRRWLDGWMPSSIRSSLSPRRRWDRKLVGK
jgi:hypothetical protein